MAALDLALAYDGDDRSRRITRAMEHAEAAIAIADNALAPALRVELMPRAAALLAGCLPLVPKAQAADLERRVTQLAGAVGAALTEQATEARRGMACLAAAMTLGDGAKLVRQASAKAAVLERALGLAEEGRTALIRAGEMKQGRGGRGGRRGPRGATAALSLAPPHRGRVSQNCRSSAARCGA